MCYLFQVSDKEILTTVCFLKQFCLQFHILRDGMTLLKHACVISRGI